MGDFGKTECCLMDFSGTLLAHGVMKIPMAGQKNFVSENDDSLMLTLIICWGKFSCREYLIYSGWDLIVGGKDLKNWWNWT
jgi:hypothetical protein